jgi:hypothetical protein
MEVTAYPGLGGSCIGEMHRTIDVDADAVLVRIQIKLSPL